MSAVFSQTFRPQFEKVIIPTPHKSSSGPSPVVRLFSAHRGTLSTVQYDGILGNCVSVVLRHGYFNILPYSRTTRPRISLSID